MNKSVLRREGISRPIGLSLMVHLLSLALFVFMPKPSSSSPPLISYPVSLVSLRTPEQQQSGVETLSPPSPPAARQQDIPLVKEATELPAAPKTTPVMPDRPAQTLNLPDRTPVDAPPQETAAIPPRLPDYEGPIEEQTGSVPFRLPDYEGPREAQPSPVPPLSIKGEASLGADGPLLNHPYYFEGIQGKISANWAPPSDLFASGSQGDISVVVAFVIQPNGQIRSRSVVLEKGSGNPFLDASAMRAVYNANPLLPLPKGITEELHVHFEFKVRPQS